MTWSEAKTYLQAAHGNKIRRRTWPAGVFIEYRIPDNAPEHEEVVYLNLPYIVQREATAGDLIPWFQAPGDAYANDWEMVAS
jgi:hypothetical protein